MGLSQDITATGENLDIRRALTDSWAVRPCPVATSLATGSLPVVIRRSVLGAIRSHGLANTKIEVCGVLVGDGYRDDHGPYVYVAAAVEGAHAAGQIAEVTFTSDTWAHINAVMDVEYPDKRIVGWYHTHPGFGIFLSAQDLFIHHSFFSAPEQLALVYDPLHETDGLFVWQNSQAVTAPYLVEEDVPAAAGPSPVGTASNEPANATGVMHPAVSGDKRRWFRLAWLFRK